MSGLLDSFAAWLFSLADPVGEIALYLTLFGAFAGALGVISMGSVLKRAGGVLFILFMLGAAAALVAGSISLGDNVGNEVRTGITDAGGGNE